MKKKYASEAVEVTEPRSSPYSSRLIPVGMGTNNADIVVVITSAKAFANPEEQELC